MLPLILVEARQFMIECLRGKENGRETLHPWRKGWEFTVQHSLRVEALAVQIASEQTPCLPDDDLTTLHLAALLHDVARLDNVTDHAGRGAEIVAGWMDNCAVGANPRVGPNGQFVGANPCVRPGSGQMGQTGQTHGSAPTGVPDREKLLSLIARHSEKDIPGPDLLHGILKDADALDEIGAISIMMCANWLDRSDPAFLTNLLERLRTVEIPYCERTLSLLNTPMAQAILAQKRHFIQTFITQLESELQPTVRS